MGWQTKFDDPIELPNERKLITLRDAANYIVKLSKAEQQAPEWQATAQVLMLVAEQSLAGCDAFNQRHKLALQCLAFHRRIGPQQPQAESAVDKQQALDLTLAIVRAFSQTAI